MAGTLTVHQLDSQVAGHPKPTAGTFYPTGVPSEARRAEAPAGLPAEAHGAEDSDGEGWWRGKDSNLRSRWGDRFTVCCV